MEALREIIGDKPVALTVTGLNRYCSSLAVCTVDFVDIGQVVVRDGWARICQERKRPCLG